MKVRTALELGAVFVLPAIAGLLVLGAIINRVAEAIDQAHVSLDDDLLDELGPEA